MAKQYWLMKSEPDVYSIRDLQRDKTTYWNGVRNYQARNFLRDQVKVGDEVLFYHSNAEPSGVAGLAKVVRSGYPDQTAWDPKSDTFDEKSKPESPTWFMVDIAFQEEFPTVLTLDRLRSAKQLKDMLVLRRGQRLSVQPVTVEEFREVLQLARQADR